MSSDPLAPGASAVGVTTRGLSGSGGGGRRDGVKVAVVLEGVDVTIGGGAGLLKLNFREFLLLSPLPPSRLGRSEGRSGSGGGV